MVGASGWGQGFGGYSLDQPVRDINDNFVGRFGTSYGMEFINQILKTLEVDQWEKLKGVECRIRREDTPRRSKIISIGHIIKDQWFCPEELYKEWENIPAVEFMKL